jgi:positive regulator of sigma E activity
MIDEYGIVTKISAGKLAIRITAPGTCESCPIHDNCYTSGKVIWVPKQEGIGINDHVRFSITNTSVLKLTALVYGIPLAAVLGGILLGYLWFFRTFGSDPRILASVGLGVFLLLLAGFGISKLDRLIGKRLAYKVVRTK